MNHNGGAAPPPQVGMVHPMAHGAPQGSYTPPPPPPHMEQPQYAAHPMGMPRKLPCLVVFLGGILKEKSRKCDELCMFEGLFVCLCLCACIFI